MTETEEKVANRIAAALEVMAANRITAALEVMANNRIAAALEVMADNQTTLVAIAAEQLALTKEMHAKAMAPKERMSGMFDEILKTMPKEVLSAIGMSLSILAEQPDGEPETAPPEIMPDAEHLCRCAHKKENHLQGDGPCVASGQCPCQAYEAMVALGSTASTPAPVLRLVPLRKDTDGNPIPRQEWCDGTEGACTVCNTHLVSRRYQDEPEVTVLGCLSCDSRKPGEPLPPRFPPLRDNGNIFGD